jgi:hypothetical protein
MLQSIKFASAFQIQPDYVYTPLCRVVCLAATASTPASPAFLLLVDYFCLYLPDINLTGTGGGRQINIIHKMDG